MKEEDEDLREQERAVLYGRIEELCAMGLDENAEEIGVLLNKMQLLLQEPPSLHPHAKGAEVSRNITWHRTSRSFAERYVTPFSYEMESGHVGPLSFKQRPGVHGGAEGEKEECQSGSASVDAKHYVPKIWVLRCGMGQSCWPSTWS